jgi:hypothetical protein
LTTGSGERLPDWVGDPLTAGVDVSPKPLPKSTTSSPGLAGEVSPGFETAGETVKKAYWFSKGRVVLGGQVLLAFGTLLIATANYGLRL